MSFRGKKRFNPLEDESFALEFGSINLVSLGRIFQ